jgi:hypothetical protein
MDSIKNKILELLNSREKLQKWIFLGIKNVKTQDLVNTIKQKIYIDNILFNHFSPYLESPLKPLIKLLFQAYWDVVEKYLLYPENLRNLLVSAKPELKQLLFSKDGIKWLNENCKRGYHKIYKYTWTQ